MHPSYFSSSHTFQLTHMPAKMATDAYSVSVQHSIPMEMPANDYESFYDDNNNNGYLKQFNDDLDVIDEFIKEKLEEEFPSMTARTTSCEQHMGNTYVAPPTQNPELELTENLSWLENTMNFQQMRNELVQTVPVQVEMSAIRFESPQHYQYTDLNNFLFQTGNFEAFGNIQILANQGNGLTNVAPANVYYTNFGNDLTTYENFRHHYVPSPETSDFDDTETVSPISQESISEVSDTEDCPSYCRWSNCRQGFSSLAKLGKHLKESHVKTIKQNNFVCSWEVCSQRLSSCYKLLAHLRTHTGEKPYKCIISGCNKAFTAAEGLKIHKRSHTGDKPCICKFCNKAYTNSSDCKKHQRTHIDTRPYACEIIGCPKRYTDPSSLRKHKKQHSAEELEQLPPKRRGRSYRATH